jgi:predicted ATPase
LRSTGNEVRKIASFGPYRLHASERILEKEGKRLRIGSRALDILLTLLEHAPEIVSTRDLIQRVWGDLVVDRGSLHVHVAALRKYLRDGEPRWGYITNVSGRGYCFAGAVTWTAAGKSACNTLPRKPLLIIGRDDVVHELAAQLKKHRFVSIVGAGGIGKTTVALGLAHRLFAEFQDGVHFLDFAGLKDPRLLVRMLASQLDLVTISEEPLPVVLAHLGDQRILLVFDNCEHVIDAVAALTENIFRDAPQVHILVTSREALRAEGEHVHHLSPLACPPADAESLTAAEAFGYSAVQLFIKHVANSGHALEFTDDEAPIVAEICRRLDGIALALELAASRVGVHGIRGTASLLDKHFRLLWHGRRTAVPRHQTLSATLDWSYNLLSATEQLILRRMAVFVGGFSFESALDVVADNLDPAQVAEILATLVEKSLVQLDNVTAMRYRLLDTTRTYAWQKLRESGEDRKVAQRHCEQLVRALEKFGAEIWARPNPDSVHFFVSNLSNVRAALDWCFSDAGDNALGVRLTGASACLFFQAGLLAECVARTERALGAPDGLTKGTRLELELLACFSQSLMVTRGNVPAAQAAIVRALGIAEHLKTAPMELYLLHGLYKWQIRSGDLRGLQELTQRVTAVAEQVADPLAKAIANGFSAVTCHFSGDNGEVQRYVDIALACPDHLSKLNLASFGYLHRIRVIQARNLWFLGYPDQAMGVAVEAAQEAEELNHPFTLCYVLMSCITVALETGSWTRTEELVRRLASVATKHHLSSYARASVGWEGRLAVARGDLPRGIQLLQTAIAALQEDGYELYRPQLSASLAEALERAGQREDAYIMINKEITWAHAHGRILSLVDLLRLKGEILGSMSQSNASEGETCLQEAIQIASQRKLLSLELRCGISLARLWADRGENRRARDFLGPIFNRFSEGFNTRDLLAAATLLRQIRSRNRSFREALP